MRDAQPYAGALEAIDRILNREAEPDEVLRQVVTTMHEKLPHYTRVCLYFVEEDALVLGPWAGGGPVERPRLQLGEGTIGAAVDRRSTQIDNDVAASDEGQSAPWTHARIGAPVLFEGQAVAAIGIDSSERGAFHDADRSFLERVALLVSAHCLVGWDTGGVPWSDVV